jgi:RNA polymerase sigma factor (sigma-70 family)
MPDPHDIKCVEIVAACARNTGDCAAWEEFLTRYGPKIKQFIRKARFLLTYGSRPPPGGLFPQLQPVDLFDEVMLRLVDDSCAALKRFAGSTEEDWLAYLAKIAYSAVREPLRRERRQRRFHRGSVPLSAVPPAQWATPNFADHRCSERILLAREIRDLCEQIIANVSGGKSARNRIIFRLHFVHDLSFGQIAACKGLNLSKSGVRDVVNRLTGRVRGILDRKGLPKGWAATGRERAKSKLPPVTQGPYRTHCGLHRGSGTVRHLRMA